MRSDAQVAWEHPGPFLRGVAWHRAPEPPADDPAHLPVTAYPRVRPDDRRVPIDTWLAAQLPVGVRLELETPGAEIELELHCQAAAGPSTSAADVIEVFVDGRLHERRLAQLGVRLVRLQLPNGRICVHLPKGVLCELPRWRVVEGSVTPVAQEPRWLAYGDSITEGWVTSGPGQCWPATAGRRLGLDVINLGFDGSARGEIVVAAQMAELPADLISLAFGTNCWTWVPTSVAQMTANLEAFLAVLRDGHPTVPILVVSPIIRPDAESVPNRLGASLAGLRAAIESVARATAGVELLSGVDLVAEDQLPDGIHPDDAGHAAIADAVVQTLTPILGKRQP